ncbi:dolichyl-phosphate-mannose-protein mannosyltransferase Ecym_5145 [Eremothecium cymbalariae DBVPG|uniref:Dolichyl-phosphate-mannose--protein mannosyltransferase n=1 Tax=Eremothecium cymbalariae (strain CBS 270.75 / DBVPG 7215 / KCTC 17166 / NRRL Y-17582) TaxID=931890 RepID=I6NCY0_ERECY|nr:hypothetical protein Ecym_5145 [Eremothecium cymbalariae DBVPG\
MPSKKVQKSPLADKTEQSATDTKNGYCFEYAGGKWLMEGSQDSPGKYRYYGYFVTVVAFVLRFKKLYYPREVVFDEVHFGKFASYYLERTYFFDVHPPFAKLLIAFVGWLVGYNGAFKFDDIGYSYETNNAPYVAYRSLSALLGTLTVPIMFNILKELNFKAVSCALGAFLVAIDNAHVIDSRLILLDATLIVSIALSIYTYIRFYKAQLRAPFSSEWYFWLYATGLSLSFVISTKYVGLFTFAMIGSAVALNLWQLLDIRAGLSLKMVFKHFFQRFNGLILFPFTVYLFWFYIHFAVLTKSGPGDNFMSGGFQETLGDSPLAKESRELQYYDIITLKHKDTGSLLHSHDAYYPLRYEDGRISSQGQQVTGYSHEDINNNWEIIPTKELPSLVGQNVLLDDVIRLRHVATDTYLLAHDVASPLYATNEEVTTVGKELGDGTELKNTLFKFQPTNKKDSGRVVKSKASVFRIFHVDTAVALWTHNDEFLPEWGFKQQEVNGNKKVLEPSNNWVVDNIVNISEERKAYSPKIVKKLSFIAKWFELQRLMFEHNNKLSSDHPFASQPESWPGSLSGVSFWTKEPETRQIYFIGNIVGWWLEVVSLALYIGIILADLLTRQRHVFTFGKLARIKLYGPLLFLFVGWCFHYFPFFLMGRQKFLHHYLPAHLIAALLTAGLWEFLLSDTKSLDISTDESDSESQYNKNPQVNEVTVTLLFLITAIGTSAFFIFFSPLVYGDRSLTPSEVLSRQWFNMKLHFAK